jgi:hypothetical protein
MPGQTVEEDYKTDLTEIKQLDLAHWIPAESADMHSAYPEDIHSMTLSEVSVLAVAADELEPHGRS